jgi:hypothetical protein
MNPALAAILQAHHIAYRFDGGRLFAEKVSTFGNLSAVVWIDVTDWTGDALARWLGY